MDQERKELEKLLLVRKSTKKLVIFHNYIWKEKKKACHKKSKL